MLKMKQELKKAGYAGEVEEFYAFVSTTLDATHTGWSYERLARNPELASHFCDRVRMLTSLPDLRDEIVMGGAENKRKKSRSK